MKFSNEMATTIHTDKNGQKYDKKMVISQMPSVRTILANEFENMRPMLTRNPKMAMDLVAKYKQQDIRLEEEEGEIDADSISTEILRQQCFNRRSINRSCKTFVYFF